MSVPTGRHARNGVIPARALPVNTMLRVHFTSILTATMTVGPAEAFLLVGGALVEHPSGRHVAYLVGHQWQVGDRHFLRFDCGAALSALRFVGPHTRHGEVFGPYRRSHAADGMFYGDLAPIARYVEDSDRWICTRSGLAWPVLAVEPVTSSAPSGR